MKKKRIVASLEYGLYYSLRWQIVFYMGLILGLLSLALIIYIIIDERDYTYLLGIVVLMFYVAAFLYVIIINSKLKSKIRLWLKDAVELEAESIVVDTKQALVLFHNITQYKISVKFFYEGIKYVKESGNSQKEKLGYAAIYSKYSNRTIKILFSKAYNQVLILKN